MCVQRKVTFLACAVFVAVCVCGDGVAAGNLLTNPGFEDGSGSVPPGWTLFGPGSVGWLSGPPCEGSRCVLLGGEELALLYQEAPSEPGKNYTLSGEAMHAGGAGIAEIKLGFFDSNIQNLAEYKLPFTAPQQWNKFTLTVGPAPSGTVWMHANVGPATGFVYIDNVHLEEAGQDVDVFDLSKKTTTFDGLGAMVFADPATAEFPHLVEIRQAALKELNIKSIRIETYLEPATIADVQALRKFTDTLGISWMMTIWNAPAPFRHPTTQLVQDIPGFAAWWAEFVDSWEKNGVPSELIELMNEPDSKGMWSTGINPEEMNQLVKLVRQNLDALGLKNTQIVSPGLSTMAWTEPNAGAYVKAHDAEAVAAVGGWSTHSWNDDMFLDYTEGGPCLEVNYLHFGPSAFAQKNVPHLISEFSTKQQTFSGVTYPAADWYGVYDESKVFPYYSVTNTMPYATRVFENSLALMNSGANLLYLWTLIDEPIQVFERAKSWGLIDLWGNPKPVYGAMKLLASYLPVGAQVVAPPNQNGREIYAAVFSHGTKVFVGVSNHANHSVIKSIRLSNAPAIGLEFISARSFEQTVKGDPSKGEPDHGEETVKEVPVTNLSDGTVKLTISLPVNAVMMVELDVIC